MSRGGSSRPYVFQYEKISSYHWRYSRHSHCHSHRFCYTWRSRCIISSTHERHILSAYHRLVPNRSLAWTLPTRNHIQSQTTLATYTCHDFCRSIGSCHSRIDSQRSDHSDLCSCSECHIRIRNVDLARHICSVEPQIPRRPLRKVFAFLARLAVNCLQ